MFRIEYRVGVCSQLEEDEGDVHAAERRQEQGKARGGADDVQRRHGNVHERKNCG